MSYALIAGPVVALIGVVAVFFVLRRKSVEKRSMYSARRSQIEHKVRAARQRTLAPHGHADSPAEAPPGAAPSPFAPTASEPTMTYQPAAYQAPASAPPPTLAAPETSPAESTWGAPPGPSPFATPAAEPAYPPAAPPAPPDEPAPYQPPAYEPPAYPPPAEPAAPAEPAWTPAPAPAESMPLQSTPPAVPAAAGASWSIVGDSKDMSAGVEQAGKRDKKSPGTAAWQLASGEAPGTETEEVVKPPSATVAVAQYAILVAGLVMVLIGVLVMIANSHGT